MIDMNREKQIEEQVRTLMLQLGVSPAPYEELIMDGELHRYDVEGDKRGSQNGAYIIHTDGIPAGYVQDWKRGQKTTWKFDSSQLSADEREYYGSVEYEEKHQAERERKRQEREKRQIEASEHARILFESLPPASGDHEYLCRKQIYPYGLRQDGERLAVPLKDIEGIVRSIQWISGDGEKRFYPEASLDGLFWNVGLDAVKADSEEQIYICEGMATGAKAYELTNRPTVAAITCSRLESISQLIHEKYPKAELIILSDDDARTERTHGSNPGVREAEKAVKTGSASVYIKPPFETPEDGTDWDDYALKYGDERCALELEEALKKAHQEQRRAAYETEAQRLGLIRSENFSEFCEPPEGEDYLIEGWLPRESLTMLFAPSGSGKGFVVSDIAYAISNPEISDWHGQKVIQHGPVVYVAGEGQRGLRKRFAGLVSYKGLKSDKTEMLIITEPVPIDDKNAEAGIERLITNIGMKYPEPVLIILDTVNTSMSGDENKTSDATSYTNAAKRLIQEFHSTVLNVHHTGLNPEAQGRARGSSVFKASMDIELKLTKTGELLTLEMTKSKDSEVKNPLVFNLVSVKVPSFHKANGDEETTCVIELNEAVTETVKSSYDKNSPKEKMSNAEKFAKETYEVAARKYGFLLEDKESSREVVALNIEDWREVFYSMSSADKEATRRQQFKRARRLLLETRHILFKREISGKDYYCIKPSGDSYESMLKVHIHKKNEDSRYKD